MNGFNSGSRFVRGQGAHQGAERFEVKKGQNPLQKALETKSGIPAIRLTLVLTSIYAIQLLMLRKVLIEPCRDVEQIHRFFWIH